MRIVTLFTFFILLSSVAESIESPEEIRMGHFAGRVSKINVKGELVRIKVGFDNVKYINKRDKLEFWDERTRGKKCKAFVMGKSNEYLLIRVPQLSFCMGQVFVNPGVYLNFFSQDLVNNVRMGKELISILLKRRLALHGKMMTHRRGLDSHIEKVNAVDLRYKVLRDKLEAEWRNELGALEEDRIVSLRNYKEIEMQIADLDSKLERYKIDDENIKLDRWSLDPRLYFNK